MTTVCQTSRSTLEIQMNQIRSDHCITCFSNLWLHSWSPVLPLLSYEWQECSQRLEFGPHVLLTTHHAAPHKRGPSKGDRRTRRRELRSPKGDDTCVYEIKSCLCQSMQRGRGMSVQCACEAPGDAKVRREPDRTEK